MSRLNLSDLLPYVLSGRRLKKQVFYRVHTFYIYSRDILALLVGFGLGFPGARSLAQNPNENLGPALAKLSFWHWLPAIFLILLVAFLRVYISRESVEKRAVLLLECEAELDAKFMEIQQALQTRNPLPKLTTIRNSVTLIVQRHRKSKSYPYVDGFAAGTEVEAELEAKKLCDKNKHYWL